MNKYKNLFNNTLIFAIGNMGSKLISILMVPLYTFYLTTSEYGSVDLITTTVSMLLPVISLSVFDAVLRFAMDKSENVSSVLSNGLIITVIGALLFTAGVTPILNYFNVHYSLFLILILILQAVQSLFSEFARSIDKVKIFAFNGILGTLATAIFNLIFLIVMHKGIYGYLWSIVLAMLICCLFLIFSLKIWEKISIQLINWKISKRMLIYSIPLIPNALSWWANSAASRYFILYFVGVSANGLYAVANKIPSLLSMINSIFFQAWQLSAIDQYDSNQNNKFYSNVFMYYSEVMFVATAMIIFLVKPIIKMFISSTFYDSWKIVPFLLISVLYSCFAGFIGTNYIAAKKTSGIMITTLLGALINIAFNFVFTPILGVIGSSIASLLSFFIIFLLRVRDTKKFVQIKYDLKLFIINNLLLIMQILVMFVIDNIFIQELIIGILLIFMIIVNVELRKLILRGFGKLKDKFNKFDHMK